MTTRKKSPIPTTLKPCSTTDLTFEVEVLCPSCEKFWKLLVAKSDTEIFYPGQFLICHKCTHSEAKHRNGGVKVNESLDVDVFPGE